MKALFLKISTALLLSCMIGNAIGPDNVDFEASPEAIKHQREMLKELEKPKIGAQTRYDGKGRSYDEALEKALDKLIHSPIKWYKISSFTNSLPQHGHPYYWVQIWITYNHD